MMNIKIVYCSLLIAFAVAASSAQTKYSFSGSCTKPDVMQTIPVGDQTGHSFAIAQGKCTDNGKIGSSMVKASAFSEHEDVMPSRVKAWGVYTQTYESGDKIFDNYELSLVMKDGAFVSGRGTYQAIGGTGKMKGVKGKGTCVFTPGPDGGDNYSCHGDYTLVSGAMAAQ